MWEAERPNDYLGSQLFALLPQHKLLFTCGHWDNSFKAFSLETMRPVQTVRTHQEVVTCMAVGMDVGREWLITGSKDCTVRAWELLPGNPDYPVGQCLRTMYGHDDVVTCVAISTELDLIVSGSNDGTMMIHTLHDFVYLRTIVFNDLTSIATTTSAAAAMSPSGTDKSEGPSGANKGGDRQVASSRVSNVVISIDGYIVAYSCDGHYLHTYSLNDLDSKGPLRRISVGERLYTMILSDDGKVLLTGGRKCLVIMRWVATLFLANDGARMGLDAVIDGCNVSAEDGITASFDSPIRSLLITKKDNKEAHLFVGMESGMMRLLAQDSEYLRRRLHKRLETTGFLK
jgi:WD40 repeat protein